LPEEASKPEVVPPQTEVPPQPEQQAQVQPSGFEEPPKSWRQGSKASWAKTPVEVRREVYRRERDHEKVFNDAAQARGIVNQFANTVRPYEARIRQYGIGPMEAVQKLFEVDHILSSSSPAMAARKIAELVRDYGVDIKELDNALAGQPPVDPVQDHVDQMLQQRLAPLNQFLIQQQAQQQAVEAQRGQQAISEVETMSGNAKKYPHFEEVRETMADLVDFYALKGVNETLDVVYQRAVAMNPTLSAISARQTMRQQAASVNNQTQRALNASVQVTGSPGGAPASGKPNGSLRDAVEAAWAAHSGR
jgi:hypothetical protein